MTDELTLDFGDLPAAPAPHRDGHASTPETMQHRLATIQLVNWGGFEGLCTITFDPDSTLMSGASGTGKSTIQDAWLALLQPSDTPFNGASNDAVGGRARSATQRNLLSYLRGQTDTTEGDDGQDKAKVLRGDGTDTWGAVAATFIDDQGRRFTALRLYYASAATTRSSDVISRLFTFDGAVDVATLEPLTATRPSPFAPAQVKAAVPGLRHHDTYSSFSQTLFTRLGIGANGDGVKALRLLARVQAGQQIRTVDELYKEMVLERPTTFDDADRAIGHFNALEDSYLKMRVEQEKADLLAPVTGWHTELRQAEDEIGVIDTFGLTLTTDSPIGLWALRTEDDLLAAAADTNRDQRHQNRDDLARARQHRSERQAELADATRAHDDAGGATLRQISIDLDTENHRRQLRDTRRTDLTSRVAALTGHLAGGLDSRDEYDIFRAAATDFRRTAATRATALQERRDGLKRDEFALQDRRRQLREDRASYERRAGRVPPWLDTLRRQVAHAAGFAPEDLPFVAELIDVGEDHQQWRTAIETVLGSSARLLLVPATHLEDFSAAIDPLHLTGRITFEGVPTGPWDPALPATSDRDRISGKLVFKGSPFTAWVFNHVSAESRNALCVPTSRDLAGPGYRVTLAGQTRRGRRGAHGRADQHNIIGFSNADTLAAIDADLQEIQAALQTLSADITAVETEQSTLRSRTEACHAVLGVNWDDIDVAGSDHRIAALTAQRDTILASSDQLQALQNRIEALTGQVDQAGRDVYALEARQTALATEQEQLIDRQDAVARDLERIDHHQTVVLSDGQQRRLDEEFASAAGDRARDLQTFPANLAGLRRRLLSRVDTARQTVTTLTERITDRFAQFQRLWYDPNLGTTLASYPDYARIYDDIEATGLHTRRNEWRRKLTEWSGQDLVPLAHSMGDAVDEIEKRLDPINTILRELPFGANANTNRLRIRMRRQRFDHVATFRRELSRLSSLATKQLTDDELETRFTDLQTFMHQIRTKDDPRGPTTATTGRSTSPAVRPAARDRDRLLDVRKHVTITAECYELDTAQLVSTHSSLGGKSGGESQELIAFIVGAALRFRLGDELRERPRFAPVFLDEGFIKADAEFAGRAVRAWRGLGFQLIIAAPLDKVTGLEPHMNQLLAITKNTHTHYAFLHPITDRLAFRADAATLTRATAGTSSGPFADTLSASRNGHTPQQAAT